MALPVIRPFKPLLVQPEPLTPSAFAPFGTVIAPPLENNLTTYPPQIPHPAHPAHQPAPVAANQKTALKTSPISPLTNNYPSQSPSPSSATGTANASKHQPGPPANGLMSIFSSFPRQNTYLTRSLRNGRRKLKLKLGILERHPYTTQTFCPFNYSEPAPISSVSVSVSIRDAMGTGQSTNDTTYILIIVAPTRHDPDSQPPNPPDLRNVRAFLAPLNRRPTLAHDDRNATDSAASNVAVTYAPGTWHAPMIVLGSCRVDFLVTQFANGVAQDDCQEVLIGSGPDESVLADEERRAREVDGLRGSQAEVEVDVSFLIGGGPSSDHGADEGVGEESQTEMWTTDAAIYRTVSASWKAKL